MKYESVIWEKKELLLWSDTNIALFLTFKVYSVV